LLPFDHAPSCLQRCHYGISQRTVFLKNQNRLYDHAPHVNVARLDCGECHSREVHKVSLPRGYKCIECHHQQAEGKECTECHQEVTDFASGGFAGHDLASLQNQECDTCHQSNTGDIVLLNRQVCRDCHLDDKAYLNKLEAELEELGRLNAQIDELKSKRWETLDAEGLRHLERVRTIRRIHGIHNYPLARRVLTDTKTHLLAAPTTTVATSTPTAAAPADSRTGRQN
jgi:hypothetical protein